MLIATTTVTIQQPPSGELYDNDVATNVVASGVPATIGSPTGRDVSAGGGSSTVTASLVIGPEPALAVDQVVTDAATGATYDIVWAEPRRGLGLEHQRAGLRRVVGAA